MMNNRKKNRNVSTLGRRQLLKSMAASCAVPLFAPVRLFGADAPSNRITLGCIGMGGQGRSYNMVNFLRIQEARVLAVCDVFDSRREAARQQVNKQYRNTDCLSHVDFRKILENKAIDAVVISTPDHWHVPMSIMAMEAGKEVFCEKPTMTIAEGRTLINEVKKHKAVFQIGLEDRSVQIYHRMVELVRNGAIGKLRDIKVVLPDGFDHPAEEPAPVPKGLNYNLWVGPAPFRPYSPRRTVQRCWRMIKDYGNGSLVDWGSHQLDTAQLAANAPDVCPVEVEGTGLIPKGRMSNVPIKYDVNYRYSNGVTMNVKSKAGGADIRLIGDKGWVGNVGWRGKLQASDKKILEAVYPPGKNKHWQKPPGEHRDFINCVKTGRKTTYTAETMHLLHVTCHLGIIAIRLGRKLRWDPKTESFPGDAAANKMRSRPNREDWRSA